MKINLPTNFDYRTCGVCGRDLNPEPMAVEGYGIRVAFACPEHGVHTVVDPFPDSED